MATKARGGVGVERTIDDTPVSTAVIRAIADAESVEPTDLELTLYEVVDLDALERLCGSSSGELVVEFAIDDYRVRVRADSAVIVEPR